jgi:hypothetical protein
MRPKAQPMLLVVLVLVPQLFAANIQRTVSSFVSQAREVEIDEYSSNAAVGDVPVIVMLSGSGGIQSPNMPFDSQARLFANQCCRVFLPHYLDVTHGSPSDPAKHYAIWAQAVRDALTFIRVETHIPPNRTVLLRILARRVGRTGRGCRRIPILKDAAVFPDSGDHLTPHLRSRDVLRSQSSLN